MTTEADPDVVRAYKEQAGLYREAMNIMLRHDAGQAAAFLAVQVVRSAASYAFVVLTGGVAEDEDTVAALWQALPEMRVPAVLLAGADVLALHDDLTLYAYTIDEMEARQVAAAADLFCTWALAVAPSAAEALSTRITSLHP
jgi:hypothetical protein